MSLTITLPNKSRCNRFWQHPSIQPAIFSHILFGVAFYYTYNTSLVSGSPVLYLCFTFIINCELWFCFIHSKKPHYHQCVYLSMGLQMCIWLGFFLPAGCVYHVECMPRTSSLNRPNKRCVCTLLPSFVLATLLHTLYISMYWV